MYLPVPHKASNHQTPSFKTMPCLFSHPEKLYWITSKPFLIFSHFLGAHVSYQAKCSTRRNILSIFFSGSVTFVPYLTLILLSAFPSQYFQIHFQLIFLLLCLLPKSLSLVLFPFVSILFLPVPFPCCPCCATPLWALSSDLLRPCLSLPSSLLELAQRS